MYEVERLMFVLYLTDVFIGCCMVVYTNIDLPIHCTSYTYLLLFFQTECIKAIVKIFWPSVYKFNCFIFVFCFDHRLVYIIYICKKINHTIRYKVPLIFQITRSLLYSKSLDSIKMNYL